jgi:hypothetical protein
MTGNQVAFIIVKLIQKIFYHLFYSSFEEISLEMKNLRKLS